MSTQTLLEGILAARDKLRNKLVSMGLVESTDKLETLVDAVDGIPNVGTTVRFIDTQNTSAKIDRGFHSGNGSIFLMTEEKTVTPTDTQQIITPTTGKVLSKVTVEAASGGSGGGGSVGTCTVTIINGGSPSEDFMLFYTDGDTLEYAVTTELGVQIKVLRNSIIVISDWGSTDVVIGECVPIQISGGSGAYCVTGDCTVEKYA